MNFSDQMPFLKVTAQKYDDICHQTEKQILVGFDGFIDYIQGIIDSRIDEQRYNFIETIEAYSQRIREAAGQSCNIEVINKQIKLGGNGPIMANALLEQKCSIDYIGALGKDQIEPIFQDFAKKCKKVYSFEEPGRTNAIEFDDGKIMMGNIASLSNVNMRNILKIVGIENLRTMLENSDGIAYVNWTNLLEMNSIFKGFDDILETIEERKKIFIDLADPKKRTKEDIGEMLAILKKMQKNSDVILGMNESESIQIANICGLTFTDNAKERASDIRNFLNNYIVVIHPLKTAVCADENNSYEVIGPYIEKPILSTGAGDNFNAGFFNGILRGLGPKEALLTGVCTSGFYVKNARSPKSDELILFMKADY